MYTLKLFNARLLRMPKNDLVTFRDHSNDFNSESSDSHRKRKCPVALPNPLYISIHATLAWVLNMSGAGRFFDELLDKYKDGEGNVPPNVPLYDPGQSWRKLWRKICWKTLLVLLSHFGQSKCIECCIAYILPIPICRLLYSLNAFFQDFRQLIEVDEVSLQDFSAY